MAPPKRSSDDDDGFGDWLAGISRGLSGQLGKVLLLGVAVLSIATSYYQVEPEEVALVTRFGRYVYTAESGPHFRWPLGIESTIKVPIQRQLKEEFGFRTVQTVSAPSQYTQDEDASKESSMLTGDLNVANVEWIVQFKIKDPYQYEFRMRDVRGTLRDVSEAVMRKVVGDHSVTEVLTVGRERIQMQAKEEMQLVCNQFQMGVEIVQLVLQDVDPPTSVRNSFNEVNQAIQERERAINQAWAAYNAVIPEAEGKAQQTLQGAEGYATERVNNARGEVQRFLAIETEYKRAPAVTRARLYLENVDRVMPQAGHRIIIDDKLKGVLPLFNLSALGATNVHSNHAGKP
ncbi:MAG: hypothetical protein RL701_2035 [Pseudomonadota bacterium]|jgi:membrane protease subunit HflK